MKGYTTDETGNDYCIKCGSIIRTDTLCDNCGNNVEVGK